MHSYILFLIVAINSIAATVGWDPSKFEYDAGPNYTLVWQDPFDNVGPAKATINGAPAYAPNPKNWTPQIGNINGGLQNYTDSIYNAYVQNNQLHIVAMKENYTSAMLNSAGLQEFTYGKFAAKIRMPYGQGMWPAWWLLVNAYKQYYFYWPTVGEIDIVEMIGGHQWGTPNDQIVRGTVHWNAAANEMDPIIEGNFGYTLNTPDQSLLHNNSLVYWAEWNTTHIVIGMNEFTITVFPTTHIPSSVNPVMAFHGLWPYYMLLNLAIGGSWPGPPDNTTVWPQEIVVDWVRVYQLKCETHIGA
jgi:beta-glucanase (GH16 family)